MTGWADHRAAGASLALLLTALAACGGGGDPGAGEDTTTLATTDAPTTTMFVVPSIPPASAAPDDGCAPGDLALVEAGVLTVATVGDTDPPWVIGDPSSGAGFDSAVAYAVAERLGFTATDVSWVAGAAAEAYDFAIGQHEVGSDPSLESSIAYYPTNHALVALPGSGGALATTMDHVSALSLGAVEGTAAPGYARDVAGATDVTGFTTAAGAFAALVAGDVEALVLDLPTAYRLTPLEAPNAVIASVLPRSGDEAGGLGLAFPAGSALVRCANDAIETLHAQGALDALGVTWLEQSGEIPRILADTIETAGAEDAGQQADYEYLIPAGTGELVGQGIVVDIMPSELSVVVGEVIRIVNEDDVGYVIGPFYVGPQETLRQRFLAAGEFVGECGVSATGTIALRVAEA